MFTSILNFHSGAHLSLRLYYVKKSKMQPPCWAWLRTEDKREMEEETNPVDSNPCYKNMTRVLWHLSHRPCPSVWLVKHYTVFKRCWMVLFSAVRLIWLIQCPVHFIWQRARQLYSNQHYWAWAPSPDSTWCAPRLRCNAPDPGLKEEQRQVR